MHIAIAMVSSPRKRGFFFGKNYDIILLSVYYDERARLT